MLLRCSNQIIKDEIDEKVATYSKRHRREIQRNLGAKPQLGHMGGDAPIKLKCILKKYYVSMRIRFNWLKIQSSGGLL
jgi:hypothetical protein